MQTRALPQDPLAGRWDVAVIGGGPAGMMTAATAAERGARVILLEKNASVGKKLLITGGGRCNVTNAEPDSKKLLAKFKNSGKFLSSPFSQWSNQDSLTFFHARGMPTKVEAEQRVFPLANTAKVVLDVLRAYMRETGVRVRTNARVTGFNVQGDRIDSVKLAGGGSVHARSFILATGGISHPETGSTGDGYPWLRSIGHTVHEARAALVPIATKDTWVKRAAGVALKSAKIRVFENGKKKEERIGKVLFTHVGLSGPGILNMSRTIGEILEYGECIIELDLLPEMGYEKVDAALQAAFKEHHTKKVRNALGGLIPPALVPAVLSLANIDPDTQSNSVTRTSRIALMRVIKHLRLTADHVLGLDKAVITAGGVDVREIDFRTMQSLKMHNLYLVGDVLDIDRPSGGYSLQLCWTTGRVAGLSAPLG